MSSALVPSNQPSGFAQQGSVDWVALSDTSVQFSVAVLSRLAKAGIDAFTLHVGRAICCSFALEPNAQERIGDAIYKLKRYGSYGSVIWFGFGIKEVVTDLADTEEGLTLVGLCASLSTVYDSLFAAKVLRELCVLCRAPKMFTPALRQWKALVELCAGILTASHFLDIASVFRRLISSYANPNFQGVGPRQSPTQHRALAAAILTLGSISRGKYTNADFFGETDCAWLAAFAEWTLSLRVEICESDGSPLYRSRSMAGDDLAQVTITIRPSDDISRRSSLIRSRASVIPSGQRLLQTDPAFTSIPLMNWQSPWTTILQDVFQKSIEILLGPQIGGHFLGYLIYCSGLRKTEDRRYPDAAHDSLNGCWKRHPVNPLLWTHPDYAGQNFLSFAFRQLPELFVCHGNAHKTQDIVFNSVGSLNPDLGKQAMDAICASCSCSLHRKTQTDLEEPSCLKVIAESIIIYLWILMDCDIDQDIWPSITGLSNLYTWQSHANKAAGPIDEPCYQSIMNCDYPVVGLDLVFHVITGLSISGTPPKYEKLPVSDKLARVGNGLCLYHYAVEDPSLPSDKLTRVRVVRGSITYDGFQYRDLTGFRNIYVVDGPNVEDFDGGSAIQSVQTMVQETDDEARLEMAFHVHYRDRRKGYSTCWLHLPFLLRKLHVISEVRSCLNQCAPLYTRTWKDRRSHTKPKLTFDIHKDCVEAAQEILNNARSNPRAYILQQEPAFYTVFSGKMLLLYITIDQRSVSLISYLPCLSCVVLDREWTRDDRISEDEWLPWADDGWSQWATITSDAGSKATLRWYMVSDEQGPNEERLHDQQASGPKLDEGEMNVQDSDDSSNIYEDILDGFFSEESESHDVGVEEESNGMDMDESEGDEQVMN